MAQSVNAWRLGYSSREQGLLTCSREPRLGLDVLKTLVTPVDDIPICGPYPPGLEVLADDFTRMASTFIVSFDRSRSSKPFNATHAAIRLRSPIRMSNTGLRSH